MRLKTRLLVAGLINFTGINFIKADDPVATTAAPPVPDFTEDPDQNSGLLDANVVKYVDRNINEMFVHSVIEWDIDAIPVHFMEGFVEQRKPGSVKDLLLYHPDFLSNQPQDVQDELQKIYAEVEKRVRASLKSAAQKFNRDKPYLQAMVQDDSITFHDMEYIVHWNYLRRGLADKALISYRIRALQSRHQPGSFYDLSVAFANRMSNRKPQGAKWKFLKSGTTTSKMLANPCLSVFEHDCDARAECLGTNHNKWRISGNRVDAARTFFGCKCPNLLESSLSLVEHRYREIRPEFRSNEDGGMLCIPNEFALGRKGYKIQDNIIWGGIWALVVTSLVLLALIIVCACTWEQRVTYNKID